MNLSNAILNKISVHYIGNKTYQQEIILSSSPLKVNKELSIKLKNYFLGRFTSVFENYNFSHPSSLKYNEVYNFSGEYFLEEDTFHEMTLNIAKHLYENSVHPKVKSGELYICHFDNCLLNDKLTEAIGIFKTEVKSGFFEINQEQNDFSIAYKEGVDINKFDKGCLIFNVNKKDGFQVCIIDNQNRGEEALYWKETFLGLRQINNDFHQTNQFLSIAKNYVTNQLTEDFEVDKTNQIDLLNRSVDYFKTHETFDKIEFEKEVFQDPGVIKSFRNFDETFRNNNEIDISDNFEISPQAVKKQARAFKSVLKLDKNFHIYIHGDKQLIERGYDSSKNLHFYKVYFQEET